MHNEIRNISTSKKAKKGCLRTEMHLRGKGNFRWFSFKLGIKKKQSYATRQSSTDWERVQEAAVNAFSNGKSMVKLPFNFGVRPAFPI